MPFQRQRAQLQLSDDVEAALERISRLRTEPGHRIERAKLLLHYARGASVSSIARALHIDAHYPQQMTIRMVLDSHFAHISKETRAYLATVPGRFEFTFTPKHDSWLNLVESFFGKMARTLLRGIRVAAKAELIDRIERYIDRLNDEPVIYRWTYKLDETSVA